MQCLSDVQTAVCPNSLQNVFQSVAEQQFKSCLKTYTAENNLGQHDKQDNDAWQTSKDDA